MADNKVKNYVEVEYDVNVSDEAMKNLEQRLERKNDYNGFPTAFIRDEGTYSFAIRAFNNEKGELEYYRSGYFVRFTGKKEEGGWAVGNPELASAVKEAKEAGFEGAWKLGPQKLNMMLVHVYNCPKNDRFEPGQDVCLLLNNTQFRAVNDMVDELRKAGMLTEVLSPNTESVPLELVIKPDLESNKKNAKIISCRPSLSGVRQELPPMRLPEGVVWEGNLDNVFVAKNKQPTDTQLKFFHTLLNEKVREIQLQAEAAISNPSELDNQGFGFDNRLES